VAHIHHLCAAKGYGFRPEVYQGMYNPVTREVEPTHPHLLPLILPTDPPPAASPRPSPTSTRKVERELLPCLRRLGMAFYAYNPLAGGILTGKHAAGAAGEPDAGRFRNNKMYQERFWKPSFFAAADKCAAPHPRRCRPLPLLLSMLSSDPPSCPPFF